MIDWADSFRPPNVNVLLKPDEFQGQTLITDPSQCYSDFQFPTCVDHSKTLRPITNLTRVIRYLNAEIFILLKCIDTEWKGKGEDL